MKKGKMQNAKEKSIVFMFMFELWHFELKIAMKICLLIFDRDLAARNILVFSKSKVKISDFGLSRALGVGKDYYQTNFNVNLKLPIAWYVNCI